MSKENSRWDKLLLLVCLVAVVLGNVLAAPFYPEYTRRVNSLADLKRRFVHSNIVFPDLGENEATEYALLLSSRTVLAKPIGYIISWNEDVDGAPHFCLLICGKDQKEGSIRSLESYGSSDFSRWVAAPAQSRNDAENIIQNLFQEDIDYLLAQ